MARQKGVIKYVGTLGDIRHFKIKAQEGFFAGMVGGPTGDQVLTALEFERTSENMNVQRCHKQLRSYASANK